MLVDQDYERYLLMFDYSFLPVPDTMVDPCAISNDVHGYKFVNHEFNTRILINFDPTENEP